MPTHQSDILVIGAGIFGITAAIELRRRGYSINLLDSGTIPNPLASSTDISKAIRLGYGTDDDYMSLAAASHEGWLRWNKIIGDDVYHPVGVAMLTKRPMSSGGFEYESYQRLVQRGLQPQRLDTKMIENRFPVFRAGAFVGGFFDINGGYVESGRAVNALAKYAQSRGIKVYENQRVTTLIEDGQRVTGIQVSSGNIFHAEHVVVAAGAWTFTLLPELQPVMKASGQSVFHLKPLKPEAYAAPQLPVFTADISRTGWYGFPLHPSEGVVKVARHTTGLPVNPDDMPVDVPLSHHKTLRRFLENALPDLYNAPVVYTRVCLYCDTFDEHLWITRHMYRNGLTVAAGGSGHGFKFGSVLGKIIADVVEDQPNPYRSKFAWRFPEDGRVYGQEEARHRE